MNLGHSTLQRVQDKTLNDLSLIVWMLLCGLVLSFFHLTQSTGKFLYHHPRLPSWFLLNTLVARIDLGRILSRFAHQPQPGIYGENGMAMDTS